MAFSSLLIILVIFALSAAIVLRPILMQEKSPSIKTVAGLDSLLAERERLYSSIEELDLALEMNKISTEDYDQSRKSLLNQAALVLAEIDKMGELAEDTREFESPSVMDDEIEKMISIRRKTIRSGTLAYCPHCEEVVDVDDQFCRNCGEAL